MLIESKIKINLIQLKKNIDHDKQKKILVWSL